MGGASAQTLGLGRRRAGSSIALRGSRRPADHQRVVRDLFEGARRGDAGRDHCLATVTAKRLAAAIEHQGPPATVRDPRSRDSAADLRLGAAAGRDCRPQQ